MLAPDCRSLHWERGLKLYRRHTLAGIVKSLPSLGAWIETFRIGNPQTVARRSLHWERGLKHRKERKDSRSPRRSLHWERGLKRSQCGSIEPPRQSLPSLGAWIETWHADEQKEFIRRRSLHWERGLKLGCGVGIGVAR